MAQSNQAFSALDWSVSDPAVHEFLATHGAKSSAEIRAAGYSCDNQPPLDAFRGDAALEAAMPSAKAKPVKKPQRVPAKLFTEEVIAFFTKQYGPVLPEPLTSTIPKPSRISLRVIPPGGKRKHLTLFTTGLSDQPMKVPAGQEAYARAELFLQLPGGWPYDNITTEKQSWPFDWLRKIAEYPAKQKTWLGGPATLIANNDPPQPLGPGAKFTTWLLLAEHDFVAADGQTIQIYRLSPLYTEERNLELEEGLPALLRAFDRQSVPFVIDLARPSVVKNRRS